MDSITLLGKRTDPAIKQEIRLYCLADKVFLEKATEICPVIYSFHKIESKRFIDGFSKEQEYKITHFWSFDFPLKMTIEHHRKRIHRIKVGCWRLEKLINK